MTTVRERAPGHARRGTPIGARIAGALGQVLLTLGALLALFVVWQVWWTDVEGAREAAAVVSQIEEDLPASPELPGVERTDPPPGETEVAEGEAVGLLYVPRWGADYEMPVSEGVGRRQVLDAGRVGHYPETQLAGEVGNFAVAGHRQTYGRPFYGVDELEPGDPIVVRTAQAWYVYRVTEKQVVTPDRVDVIAPVPGDPGAEATERTITLTTCHPLWSTRERYVVHGVLDHWVDPADGRPAVMMGGHA